jgi:hypothetical protein
MLFLTQRYWVFGLCKVRKPNISVCYTPSSEPYSIYLYNRYGPCIYPSFRKLERLKLQLAKTLIHITFLRRCKSQDIIPKGFSVKTPFNSRSSTKIALRASQALLRNRLHYQWQKKTSQLYEIRQLEEFFKSSVNRSDQQRIFTAVESSFKKIFNKQKDIHIRKIFPSQQSTK